MDINAFSFSLTLQVATPATTAVAIFTLLALALSVMRTLPVLLPASKHVHLASTSLLAAAGPPFAVLLSVALGVQVAVSLRNHYHEYKAPLVLGSVVAGAPSSWVLLLTSFRKYRGSKWRLSPLVRLGCTAAVALWAALLLLYFLLYWNVRKATSFKSVSAFLLCLNSLPALAYFLLFDAVEPRPQSLSAFIGTSGPASGRISAAIELRRPVRVGRAATWLRLMACGYFATLVVYSVYVHSTVAFANNEDKFTGIFDSLVLMTFDGALVGLLAVGVKPRVAWVTFFVVTERVVLVAVGTADWFVGAAALLLLFAYVVVHPVAVLYNPAQSPADAVSLHVRRITALDGRPPALDGRPPALDGRPPASAPRSVTACLHAVQHSVALQADLVLLVVAMVAGAATVAFASIKTPAFPHVRLFDDSHGQEEFGTVAVLYCVSYRLYKQFWRLYSMHIPDPHDFVTQPSVIITYMLCMLLAGSVIVFQYVVTESVYLAVLSQSLAICVIVGLPTVRWWSAKDYTWSLEHSNRRHTVIVALFLLLTVAGLTLQGFVLQPQTADGEGWRAWAASTSSVTVFGIAVAAHVWRSTFRLKKSVSLMVVGSHSATCSVVGALRCFFSCVAVCLCVCLCMCLYVRLSVRPSIRPSVCLSVCPSICLCSAL